MKFICCYVMNCNCLTNNSENIAFCFILSSVSYEAYFLKIAGCLT